MNWKFVRRMMLKALYDDPTKYLDVLRVATPEQRYRNRSLCHNIHFTRTTQLPTENPESFCRLRGPHLDDLGLLDAYIEQIENYIASGLLEEYLLQNQRIAYGLAVKKRLELDPDDQITIIKQLKNSVNLKEYGIAFQLVDLLQKKWPDDESTWI